MLYTTKIHKQIQLGLQTNPPKLLNLIEVNKFYIGNNFDFVVLALLYQCTSAASQCLLLLTCCCCCCCCCWILSINSGKADQGTRKGSARSKHQWYPTESPGKMSILFTKASLIYFCTRAILGGTKTGGCPGILIDGCWDNIRLFMRWPPCQSSSSPDINRIHLNIFAVAKYVFKYLDWFVFGILLESIMPKTFLHFSQLHQTLPLSPIALHCIALWLEISAS